MFYEGNDFVKYTDIVYSLQHLPKLEYILLNPHIQILKKY